MSLKPFFNLLREGRLTPVLGVGAALKPFYKLTWLAAAGESGLLNRLASGPATFESLAQGGGTAGQRREALEAWLQLGVRLKLLNLGAGGYELRGMANALARPENDATLAMVQEVAGLHHKLIADTLPRVRRGELFTLADQDGELIARSSRILEPFQVEAIQEFFPGSGNVRLLEIGCGSGVYLRYAAARNASLTAVGLELQPAVAEMARRNLRGWGLEGRVKVEDGDFRARPVGELFDIATLYNNIYYFPVAERVALLERIASFLKPGGFLLLTTCCQGGSLGAEALNLWGAATSGAGRLPAEDELVGQLRQAGFGVVKTKSLLPGDKFLAFQAFRG
ncbi:SAM-dependent methyltransferase [Occallatibacter riparius]|uniref:Class I SAM-dependent methyltransferase n=1 Tax=Occallatibacter riparius TaxID=1002689 RepID=A0A9J7BPT8_9BACT|nr:class I SAM-dependent methyltransferase [Occallatibacter riparius]UWZ84615.1 class I SAM-dependent methyltransferase [Occallatibacter riparius]